MLNPKHHRKESTLSNEKYLYSETPKKIKKAFRLTYIQLIISKNNIIYFFFSFVHNTSHNSIGKIAKIVKQDAVTEVQTLSYLV